MQSFLTDHEILQINKIIFDFTEDTHFNTRRLNLMHSINMLMHCSYGLFYISSSPGDINAEMSNPLGFNVSSEKVATYKNIYFKNYYRQKCPHLFRSSIFKPTDIYTMEELKTNPHYAIHMDSAPYILEADFANERGFLGEIFLNRSVEYPDFDEHDIFIMKLLEPYITRELEKFFATASESTDSFSLKNIMTDYNLSLRDYQILKLVIENENNTVIADTLHLSESTVKKSLSSLYKRFGVKGRLELVNTISHLCLNN